VKWSYWNVQICYFDQDIRRSWSEVCKAKFPNPEPRWENVTCSGGLHWCRSPLLPVSLVFCDRVSTPPTVLPLVCVCMGALHGTEWIIVATAKCCDQILYYCRTIKSEMGTQCRLRFKCVLSANCTKRVTYYCMACAKTHRKKYVLLSVASIRRILVLLCFGAEVFVLKANDVPTVLPE